MLKLITEDDTTRRSYATWTVRAGPAFLFTLRQAPGRGLPVWWMDSIAEPEHTHGLCSCGAGDSLAAASLLHGFELGIAATARWIAVELLKHPAPPTMAAKRRGIDGVALWLVQAQRGKPSRTLRLHSASTEGGAHVVLGTVDQAGPVYTTISNAVGASGHVYQLATKEHALAALIEHAAPWIAVALLKEVEP